MTKDQDIKLDGIDSNISPFAFQYYAKDFFEAYKKHKLGPKFSPARLFLITRSIELAAKGLHLAHGRTWANIKSMNHNLMNACDSSILALYGISLSANEETQLKKANGYYNFKGFEYFLFKLPGVQPERSGPQMALSGWPELPDEGILEVILEKLLLPKL